MSMQIDVHIACHVCGQEYDTKIYRTIWGEYPENRELVMSDKINIITCPHCGTKTPVSASLFYTNAKKEFAVWYEPVPDPMIDQDAAGYRDVMGPDGYLATAPRIKDWEEFKKTIEEFETGKRKSTGAPDVGSALKRFFAKFGSQ